jgi:hypothetical protein
MDDHGYTKLKISTAFSPAAEGLTLTTNNPQILSYQIMNITFRAVPKALPPERLTKLQIIQAVPGQSRSGDKKCLSCTYRDLRTGATFNDSVWLTEASVFKLEDFIASAGLTIPDNGLPYRFDESDFEKRLVYGVIAYRSGSKDPTKRFAQIDRFVTEDEALAEDPTLASLPIPADAKTHSYERELTREARAQLAVKR